MRILFDCTDTAHSRQQSGIPQVVRNLHAQLARRNDVGPVVFDRYSRRWRPADARERRWLEPGHHVAGSARAWSSVRPCTRARGSTPYHRPSARTSTKTSTTWASEHTLNCRSDARYAPVTGAVAPSGVKA